MTCIEFGLFSCFSLAYSPSHDYRFYLAAVTLFFADQGSCFVKVGSCGRTLVRSTNQFVNDWKNLVLKE